MTFFDSMEHVLSNWFVSVWGLTDKCDNRCQVCDEVDGNAVVICIPEVTYRHYSSVL